MSVYIQSVGVEVPERRVSNAELAQMVDTTDEWIRSHTGIGSRHIAADGTLTSDLAATAARSALAKAGIVPGDLDFIVIATATPDYFGFPSTACIVQKKLGALGCPAFDLTAGCTGFIYALNVASSLLEANRKKHALVIGAETLFENHQLGGPLDLRPFGRRRGSRNSDAHGGRRQPLLRQRPRRGRNRSGRPSPGPIGAREDLPPGPSHRPPPRDERPQRLQFRGQDDPEHRHPPAGDLREEARGDRLDHPAPGQRQDHPGGREKGSAPPRSIST